MVVYVYTLLVGRSEGTTVGSISLLALVLPSSVSQSVRLSRREADKASQAASQCDSNQGFGADGFSMALQFTLHLRWLGDFNSGL